MTGSGTSISCRRRGEAAVKGKFVIKDSGNPNASAGGLWVGLQTATAELVTRAFSTIFKSGARPTSCW